MTETQAWILIVLVLAWLSDHANARANKLSEGTWRFAAIAYAAASVALFAYVLWA